MEFVPQQQPIDSYLENGGRLIDLSEVWQIQDAKAPDFPPRFFMAPNAALAERTVRGMLRSDHGNNQYATAPEDFRAVRVCFFDHANLRIVNSDDAWMVINFKDFV